VGVSFQQIQKYESAGNRISPSRLYQFARAKLRHLVTETQRTANDLIGEAVDMLAEKYGERPQQPTGKKTSRRDRSSG
jgi:hypothetical protein